MSKIVNPSKRQIIINSTIITGLYLTISSFFTLLGSIDTSSNSGVISNKEYRPDKTLMHALQTETVVSAVAGLVYYTLATSANANYPQWVLNRRYLDWYLTVPLLILSFSLYTQFSSLKVNSVRADLRLKIAREILSDKYTTEQEKEFIKQLDVDDVKDTEFGKWWVYLAIYTSIYAMLTLGFYGENSDDNNTKYLLVILGFIPLISLTYFTYILNKEHIDNIIKYKEIVTFTEWQLPAIILFVIWGIYGVNALLPRDMVVIRHLVYNILDGSSKASFGIFLWWKYTTYEKNYQKSLDEQYKKVQSMVKI